MVRHSDAKTKISNTFFFNICFFCIGTNQLNGTRPGRDCFGGNSFLRAAENRSFLSFSFPFISLGWVQKIVILKGGKSLTIKRSNQKKKKKGILHTKNGIGDRDVSSTGQGLWLCHDFDSWQQQKRKKAKRTSGYLLFFLFWRGGAVALCGLAICRDDYCGW